MQKRKYLVVLANNFARHVIRHFLQTSDSDVVALDFTDRNGIRPLLLTHGLWVVEKSWDAVYSGWEYSSELKQIDKYTAV